MININGQFLHLQRYTLYIHRTSYFFVVELYFVLVSYQTIKNKHIRIVKYQENKNEKHQYYWHRTNIMTTFNIITDKICRKLQFLLYFHTKF